MKVINLRARSEHCFESVIVGIENLIWRIMSARTVESGWNFGVFQFSLRRLKEQSVVD